MARIWCCLRVFQKMNPRENTATRRWWLYSLSIFKYFPAVSFFSAKNTAVVMKTFRYKVKRFLQADWRRLCCLYGRDAGERSLSSPGYVMLPDQTQLPVNTGQILLVKGRKVHPLKCCRYVRKSSRLPSPGGSRRTPPPR